MIEAIMAILAALLAVMLVVFVVAAVDFGREAFERARERLTRRAPYRKKGRRW